MKRQAIALKTNKQYKKEIFLSVGLLLAVGSLTGLPAGAQSIDQESCLPPEVIPVNAAVKYMAVDLTNTGAPTNAPTNAPGLVPTVQSTNAQASAGAQAPMQTAQEARQAIFNSLMGTNVYPQFNGQNSSFSQNGNMAGVPNMNSNMPQTLSNGGSDQSNSVNSAQYNNLMSSASSQPQTLTGSANTPSTSQPRTSAGIGGLAGLVAGVGAPVLGAASGGASGIYNAGYFGGSLLNMGLHF